MPRKSIKCPKCEEPITKKCNFCPSCGELLNEIVFSIPSKRSTKVETAMEKLGISEKNAKKYGYGTVERMKNSILGELEQTKQADYKSESVGPMARF